MFKMITSSMLAAGALFVLAPSQASAAYKCTINPAICQAVCGKAICGDFAAGDRDLKRMERSKSVQRISAGSSSPTRTAGYTCFNPAICRAVCGSASC